MSNILIKDFIECLSSAKQDTHLYFVLPNGERGLLCTISFAGMGSLILEGGLPEYCCVIELAPIKEMSYVRNEVREGD